ncbi:MAG: hypothetical protein QOJ63_290 [Solirubrobacteraceae bacterium]|jgi:uncharacterized protein YkwD|nr:hypothetical protein [Solirubrobacteraceae bacterium]
MLKRPLILALISCLAFPVVAHAATGDPVLDPEEKSFCNQINVYRAQNRLAPVKVSVALTKASDWLSADMARNDYFDHTDSLNRAFSKRISAFGYTGATRGENIAGSANGTATAMFNLWKGSAAHKKNMLSASFKVIGIGRTFGANTMLGWYWTTDFGGTVDRTMPC